MEQQYILKAIDAALAAGEAILSIYEDPASDFQIERKVDNSPLTIADRKAHQVISKMLSDTPYPILSEEGRSISYLSDTPYPILSEEGRSISYKERSQWESFWIVDPLDGTKEFIKRNGEFTVNIAWVSGSLPRMGVIYVPVKRILYFADERLGAYKLEGITSREDATLGELMARAVKLPSDKGHEGYVVVASRSHLTPETEQFVKEARTNHRKVEMVSKGSSIKMCLVAEGLADVYPRFAPTMEWDTAAGHAIVRAAGGEIYRTDVYEPLHYNKENLLNPWFIVYPKREKDTI